MTKTEIEQLLSEYYRQVAALNSQAWREAFAEDAVVYDPVGKPPLNVQQDADKFFEILSKFYEKLDIAPEQIFVAGNGAAVKWKMNVVARNGRTATSEGIAIFDLNEAGKIQKLQSYWDEAAMKAKLMG
ncbi:nuclear transport factor 2 family protein [Capilliphycus salinus ALCB114379]|uniref:nuclear transport factor 2 family protein n=1 Tax=Capilliphycus salinus TaxID=2768948 RepID=UPI0039A519E9